MLNISVCLSAFTQGGRRERGLAVPCGPVHKMKMKWLSNVWNRRANKHHLAPAAQDEVSKLETRRQQCEDGRTELKTNP